MLFSKNAKKNWKWFSWLPNNSILFVKSPKYIENTSVDYQTKESISQWIAKLLKAFNSVYFVIKSANDIENRWADKETKEIICSMDCKTF